jgi:nucleoside-diphosphate-sugar epimerase
MLNNAPAPAPTLLITGATGLLGGALAADLLASAQWSNVLLLVRGEDSFHAHQRTVRSLARFVTDRELLARIKPEQILPGDFTNPGAFIQDARLTTIRRVVHCAALTSFGVTARAFSTNVDGTLRFVHHLRQVATIERFLHVSTAMICGTQPPSVVHEDEYPRANVEHLVDYTESKAEAERLLRLTLPGFPLIVVRPSIIAGHTALGCGPSSSIFWTFRMGDALGMVTSQLDSRIDVIPVDYAAAALKLLILKDRLMYSSYHISAGEEACCNWHEIADAFGASKAPAPGGLRTMTGYRTATVAEIEERKPEFDSLFGRCSKSFMMKAFKLYGGFAGLNTVFDTSRLRAEGMAASPRFCDYLGTCVESSGAMTIAEQMMIDFAP